VLGGSAEEISRWPDIGLADSALHPPAAAFGAVELDPDVFDRAAVLCARNHSLLDGNKRAAYLVGLEFLARNAIEWVPPSVDDTAGTIERVAAGAISEGELARWLRSTRA